VGVKKRTERARDLRLSLLTLPASRRSWSSKIDGEHHAVQREADSRRTDILEQAGWRVIRFPVSQALQNIDGAWAEIALVLGADT